MPSTLTWVDHDSKARERSLKILALFQERDSRDELGLGVVRDSFADQFFPGTSTIQTRLRYMLIVPWVYQLLENKRYPGSEFAARARKVETSLILPLLSNEDKNGVFGVNARGKLKRLPSSVYWAGLGAWGIRRFDASQDEYHRGIDAVYRRRDQQRKRGKEGDDAPGPVTVTWHPKMPKPPRDFPERIDFRLTKKEADFILDCIRIRQKDSLLSFLADPCQPTEEDFPWEHPGYGGFRPAHQELLQHARRFSEIMNGAAILYNLLLGEIKQWEELVEEHREGLDYWADSLDIGDLRGWSIPRFWELTLDHGHTITQPTRHFIETWVDLARQKPKTLADDRSARLLIEQRERSLKGAQSRFVNERARDQWSGYAGTRRMNYRWPTAKTFLKDLYDGLMEEDDAES